MRCWNCLNEQSKRDHVCQDCGQNLRPNPMQKLAARGRVEYLLNEAEHWKFLPPEVRTELLSIYARRRERLEDAATKASAIWPESDWTSPLLTEPSSKVRDRLESISKTVAAASEPVVDEEVTATPEDVVPEVAAAEEAVPVEARPEELVAARSVEEPEEEATPELFVPRGSVAPQPVQRGMAPANDYASKLIAEADVRWFHSLGALLVLAAVIGWLRTSWDSYGKGLTGFLIVLSPAALFFLSRSLRKSVPLSARLLGILGGILTAPALLAMHLFGFLPAGVHFGNYWTFAMLVSSVILGVQAQLTREKIPLYLGAVCAILAGWSQGALWTSAISLTVGFVLSRYSPANLDSQEERDWKNHISRLSLASGFFGSFATLALFESGSTPYVPLLMFSGALLFLHLPTLTGDSAGNSGGRVVTGAALSVLGMLLMRFALDLPPSAVSLYALFACGLFLAARPDDETGLLALRCGSMLGFVSILFGLAPGLGAEQTVGHGALAFVLGLAGTAFFAVMSRKKHLATQQLNLVLLALLSLTRGWFRLFLALCPRQDGFFPAHDDLALLVGSFWVLVPGLLLASRLLSQKERELTQSYGLVLTLGTFMAQMLLALGAGLDSGPLALTALLGASMVLAWERGLLPRFQIEDESALGGFRQLFHICAPRISIWLAVLGVMLLQLMKPRPVLGLCELALLVVAVAAWKNYRLPAMELAWLLSFPTLAFFWESRGVPTQFLVPAYLIVLSWAAPRFRTASFVGAAGMTGLVMLGIPHQFPVATVLVWPWLYGLAYASPFPGRGPWEPGKLAQLGFDGLLVTGLMMVLGRAEFLAGSVPSLVAAAALVVFAVALALVRRSDFPARFVAVHSPLVVLATTAVWSLNQGPAESGLLLLLASGAALAVFKSEHRFDLANGLALLGVTWLASKELLPVNLLVLFGGLLASELVSLAVRKFRPDRSNPVLLTGGLVLGLVETDPMLRLLGITLGGVAGLRGLVQERLWLMGSGALMLLRYADQTMVHSTSEFKYRVLPTVVVMTAVSLYLWSREQHAVRKFIGSPAGLLRVALALNVIPSLLAFTFGQQMFENFAWALGSGVIYLLASALARGEVRHTFRQAGGWALSGWAVVTLGRGALLLPWQAATAVVGIGLVVVGVVAERKRRKTA